MQDFGSGDTSSNLVGGMLTKVRILLQPVSLDLPLAGLVLTRVLDPVTAHQVVGIITGMGV
jgi:hypothetical protein